MKIKITIPKSMYTFRLCLSVSLFFLQSLTFAQDTTIVSVEDSSNAINNVTAPKKIKPVKNTFESVWIIDNQTVMVPIKGTLEMDIMHRFGTVNKGYDDFWGFFAPSNIRLAVSYAPIEKLFVGIGITKEHMLLDANAKYAIIRQTKGKYPVSITYYGNVARDTRKDPDGSIFKYNTQRWSFFNQLLIARKLNDKISLQVGPSISHQNAVNGYLTKNDSTGKTIFKEMKHEHFAIAFSGKYKLTKTTTIMVNYDQPITKHATRNPDPNLSFGFDFNTGSHSFQLFMGNYSLLSPQQNNLYNANSPFKYTKTDGTKVKSGFLIGFNITRLWNY